MKKLNMLFALVGVLLLAVGCEKKANVAFTTSTVSIAAEGGETTASLTSNGDWNMVSRPDWLTVVPESGSGDAQLVLTASANLSGDARMGEVKVSTKNNTATLTVTQEAYVESTYLRVIPDYFYCDRWGDTFQIDVESNVDWTLTEIPDWISASMTEGSNDGHIEVVVAPITEIAMEDRQATLVFSGGGLRATVVVAQSQESHQVFEVSPVDLEFSSLGGTMSLVVTSTMPWTATTEAGWFAVDPSSGEGDAELLVKVSENTEFESREGRIQFAYKYPSGVTGSIAVWVRQEAALDPHFLTVSPQELLFEKEGGTAEITVECDTDWTVDLQSDWVSLSALNGTGNATVTISVIPNAVTEPRLTDFTFISGNLRQIVHVRQEKGEEQPMVALSPDTIFVSSAGAVSSLSISSNTSWSLEANALWIMMLSPSGYGDGIKDVIVDSNTSSEARYCQIRALHNEQIMDVAVVAQEGKLYILQTDISLIEARPEGGQYTINVTSTMNWVVSKGAPWLSYTPTSGFGNGQIVVTIEPMSSPRPREAEIYITADNGATIVIPVSQSN